MHRKLLRKRDYLMLGLAVAGDIVAEVVAAGNRARKLSSVMSMYPNSYKRRNFTNLVGKLLRTDYIERTIDKNGEAVFRLTAFGQDYVAREFPIKRFRLKWDGRWTVVIFDIPEQTRWIRDRLRFDLEDLGFGGLQKSVWISPFPIADDLREYLINSGLAGQALVMVGPWMLAGDERELARRAFKLDTINERYRKLLVRWDTGKKGEKAKKKFASRYLEILASDPLLPYRLLPHDWLGEETREIFKSIFTS